MLNIRSQTFSLKEVFSQIFHANSKSVDTTSFNRRYAKYFASNVHYIFLMVDDLNLRIVNTFRGIYIFRVQIVYHKGYVEMVHINWHLSDK